MKNKKILIFIYLITNIVSVFAQKGEISGYLIDKLSKEPVIGATIILFETNDMTVSDANGFFKVSNLESGEYSFGVKLIGYKDTTISNVVVEPDLNLELNIFLSECKYHILGHPKTCPICGKSDNVVPILYGVATKKMIKKEKKGLALLGGDRTGCDPLYYCKKDKIKF